MATTTEAALTFHVVGLAIGTFFGILLTKAAMPGGTSIEMPGFVVLYDALVALGWAILAFGVRGASFSPAAKTITLDRFVGSRVIALDDAVSLRASVWLASNRLGVLRTRRGVYVLLLPMDGLGRLVDVLGRARPGFVSSGF